jgi:site-specific DNA-methyltransferase (adenine-specific)
VTNLSINHGQGTSARQAKYGDKRAVPTGKNLDDVWTISRVAGTHGQRIEGVPTQLPIELLRRVVGCASESGDLVVDPFNGSGTTGVACVELGRKYFGIDKSDRFASLARARLTQIQTPLECSA